MNFVFYSSCYEWIILIQIVLNFAFEFLHYRFWSFCCCFLQAFFKNLVFICVFFPVCFCITASWFSRRYLILCSPLFFWMIQVQNYIYTIGCTDAFVHWLAEHLDLTGAIALGFAIPQVVWLLDIVENLQCSHYSFTELMN